MTAKEFWKQKFDEYPQNDAEKLAVVMMQEYSQYILTDKDKEIERLKGYSNPVYYEGAQDGFLAVAFNKDAVEFPFAEWASHSDWTYLPSKKLWYNEEDEENITPKTTQELYNLYLDSIKQIKQ